MYSEKIPHMSNTEWDVSFIRGELLSNQFSMRVLSLLSEKFLSAYSDIIVSVLANLIGIAYKKRPDVLNIQSLVRILNQASWLPDITWHISE
jgi:hypothetical protein